MSNPKGTWFTCGPDAPSGYSPRLFVLGEFEARYDDNYQATPVEEAHRYLKAQCMWGGSDKGWNSAKGEWWGFEIPRESYETCVAYLTKLLGEPIDQREALK